jgi:hypothetical protein
MATTSWRQTASSMGKSRGSLRWWWYFIIMPNKQSKKHKLKTLLTNRDCHIRLPNWFVKRKYLSKSRIWVSSVRNVTHDMLHWEPWKGWVDPCRPVMSFRALNLSWCGL